MNRPTEVNEIIYTCCYFSDMSGVYFAAELFQEHRKVLRVYPYQPHWLMYSCPGNVLALKPNAPLPPALFVMVYKEFKLDAAQEAGVKFD